MFMVSITQPHHYYQTFLSQGVGMGVGMGLMFIPTMSVVSHYFHRRRGLAMGVVIAGKHHTYAVLSLTHVDTEPW